MRRHHVLLLALAAVLLTTVTPVAAGDWIFRRSRYSHDPVTGKRVAQYAPKTPAYARDDPTYRESGYRHIRRSVRGADGSADRMHIVQAWGEGEMIRPYGEWQRPYRAGATPYGPWGNARGPWTTPYESWSNPYGLGQLRHPPYPHYEQPYGYGPGYPSPGYPPQQPVSPSETAPPAK